jgi:hypothetical protein
VPAAAVRRIALVHGGETRRAERIPGGWAADGRPATAGVAEALVDLVDLLCTLRAIDVFRARDTASWGLDRPQSRIVVATARRTVELDLGDPNAGGSAFYARRAGDPRTLLVGTTVASAMERVLYQRKVARGEPL